MEIDYFSAFIIGLLGSGHCMGMCGGITTMLTSAIGNQQQSNNYKIIGYNLGRISSYSVIGAIAGFTGSLAIKTIGLPILSLKLFAGCFLILLGLYIGQWLMWLTQLEHIGKQLWQIIYPFTKHLIPVTNIKKAIFLGILWGWLPCGLVYSTLTWSMASGSAINGALIMLFFGIGTLPALLGMSFGVLKMQRVFKNNYIRKSIAILLIIYGIYTLKFAYNLFV